MQGCEIALGALLERTSYGEKKKKEGQIGTYTVHCRTDNRTASQKYMVLTPESAATFDHVTASAFQPPTTIASTSASVALHSFPRPLPLKSHLVSPQACCRCNANCPPSLADATGARPSIIVNPRHARRARHLDTSQVPSLFGITPSPEIHYNFPLFCTLLYLSFFLAPRTLGQLSTFISAVEPGTHALPQYLPCA